MQLKDYVKQLDRRKCWQVSQIFLKNQINYKYESLINKVYWQSFSSQIRQYYVLERIKLIVFRLCPEKFILWFIWLSRFLYCGFHICVELSPHNSYRSSPLLILGQGPVSSSSSFKQSLYNLARLAANTVLLSWHTVSAGTSGLQDANSLNCPFLS